MSGINTKAPKRALVRRSSNPYGRPDGWDEKNPAFIILWEKPHPLLKVPGTGNAQWDGYLGRWVVL